MRRTCCAALKPFKGVKKMKSKQIFTGSKKAVNYHITDACNMRCGYCFVKYEPLKKKYLSFEESIDLVDLIAASGCEKLTVVGGEPILIGSFL